MSRQSSTVDLLVDAREQLAKLIETVGMAGEELKVLDRRDEHYPRISERLAVDWAQGDLDALLSKAVVRLGTLTAAARGLEKGGSR